MLPCIEAHHEIPEMIPPDLYKGLALEMDQIDVLDA
jgi:hypothetical protein